MPIPEGGGGIPPAGGPIGGMGEDMPIPLGGGAIPVGGPKPGAPLGGGIMEGGAVAAGTGAPVAVLKNMIGDFMAGLPVVGEGAP
jgi:hypothetical protein